MELRTAACRGGWYQTDQSASAHGPHSYFWDQWAEPSECPGWSQAESDAENLVRLLLGTDRMLPGLALRCHPVVEYAMMGVMVPSYAEFVDPSQMWSVPLQKVDGVPVMRTVAAERGAWEIVGGEGVIASGTVRLGFSGEAQSQHGPRVA